MRARLQWLAASMVGIGTMVVTSRRWSGPLLASALGMGLFIGVAFGPAIDRLDALGSQVIALDGGSQSAAEPASDVQPTSASSNDATDGGVDPTATPAPAPYIPAAPIPAPPPVEDPPPDDPPADPPTDPGNGDDEPDPATFAGTVVHVNPLAGSYALAVRGELYGVHSKDLPAPGEQLEVPLLGLANGTYAEDGDRDSQGETKDGSLNGFVTWVSPEGAEPAYTVSVRGVSARIAVPEDAGGELPKLGEFVNVKAEIEDPPPDEAAQRPRPRHGLGLLGEVVATPDPGTPDPPAPAATCVRDDPVKVVKPEETLVQTDVEPTGDKFDYFDLAGYVQAICPGEGELVISSDDIRAGGTDITLTVPESLDVGDLELDDPVLATAEVSKDGKLTLAGLASDDGTDGADDDAQLQGDLGG